MNAVGATLLEILLDAEEPAVAVVELLADLKEAGHTQPSVYRARARLLAAARWSRSSGWARTEVAEVPVRLRGHVA